LKLPPKSGDPMPMPSKFIPYGLLLLILAACASEPSSVAIFFPSDDQYVTPEGRRVVAQIALKVAATHPSRILVEGHANGATADQSVLAQARADEVAHALVEEGVSPALIQAHAGVPAEGEKDVATRKVLVTLVP
jgi:hypothetical protein